MKVWVLGEGKESRAGAAEEGVTNRETRIGQGRIQDHDGLCVFSLALLFIYWDIWTNLCPSPLPCHITYGCLGVIKLLTQSSSYSLSTLGHNQTRWGMNKTWVGFGDLWDFVSLIVGGKWGHLQWYEGQQTWQDVMLLRMLAHLNMGQRKGRKCMEEDLTKGVESAESPLPTQALPSWHCLFSLSSAKWEKPAMTLPRTAFLIGSRFPNEKHSCKFRKTARRSHHTLRAVGSRNRHSWGSSGNPVLSSLWVSCFQELFQSVSAVGGDSSSLVPLASLRLSVTYSSASLCFPWPSLLQPSQWWCKHLSACIKVHLTWKATVSRVSLTALASFICTQIHKHV